MAGWIGVDLGASRIRVAALGETDGIYRAIPTPAPHGMRHFTQLLREAAGIAGRPVSVSLARAPGIDSSGIIESWPSRPEWVGIPLLSIIRKCVGEVPFHMDDGAAAAIWESADVRNAGKTTAAIVIGTGLAIGCARDGLPIETGNGAATPAHEYVKGWDAPCRCGKHGCLQTALSARGLRAAISKDKREALKITGNALKTAEALMRSRYKAEHMTVSGSVLLNPAVKAFLVESVPRHRRGKILFSAAPRSTVIGGALLNAALMQQRQEGTLDGGLPELRNAISGWLAKRETRQTPE